MPDTALDPFAVPFGFRDVPAGEAPPPPPPEQTEVAQAPVQETAPAAPVQTAPAQPTAPLDDRAFIPDLAPRNIPLGTQVQTQSGPQAAGLPGGLNFIERPDEEDHRDYVAARNAEKEIFTNNLREHQEPYHTLKAPNLVDYRELPKWQELQQLREHYPNLTPRERSEAERTVRAEEARLIAETNQRNKQAQTVYTQQRNADMQRIDEARSTPEAREKTSALIEGQRSALELEQKTRQSSNVPKDKNEADYTIRTSPLSTMKAPDFSDAVSRIAVLNGAITPRQAVQYGLILGSPVNRNEKGELQPGVNKVNGKSVIGKGATAFEVVGKDYRNNVLVRMPDNQILRVPSTTFNQFADVRVRGYGEQRKWWAERRKSIEDASKPDWVTRQVQGVVDYARRQRQ